MFTSINRTVFDIPLTWDRTRFEASRIKCRQARKLIEMSINAQFNKQLKDVYYQKLDIEKDITDSQQRLLNQERKVRVLDNLTEVALQSLTDYFDKRMEHVRSAIQEHCNAIQQILCEENEHWNEIHTAIDQNLITSDDLHPPNNIDPETPLSNIHTINEVDEEEHTSKLLTNKTVTPLLTQMIRKSRLLSNRPTINNESNRLSTNNESNRPSTNNESNRPSSMDNLIQSKKERFSVIIPLASARRTLHVIDTTFVVKLEESRNTEASQSPQVEVVPIESLPTAAEVEATPSYSQPKLPARLYFSPTLLQDDDEPELIPPVLSTLDQNQTNNGKPRKISRRFGQTFLLDNIKHEELNESEDTENLRPKISDEIPFMIHCDPTMLPEDEVLNESHHSDIVEHHKSIVYAKRRTQADVTTKIESETIHMTRRATRNRKPIEEIEINKRQPRKRKQSTSDDGINTTVALRKKKAVPPPPAKTKTRKPRAKKSKEIPIREPSPLPVIDRSKHYSTRFSTRSHRFNNLTLSTTVMTDDDDHNNNKSKHSSSRLRTKSTGRTRNHEDDGNGQMLLKNRSKQTKIQPVQRAKSMRVTRNRRKEK